MSHVAQHWRAGCEIPGNFPEDYYPVIGMTVASCVQYYNSTVGGGTWDVDVVTRKVLAAKEGLYEKLAADGIQAFAGARALILEAKSLGISIGVGSSGVPLQLVSCSGSSGAIGVCTLEGPDGLRWCHFGGQCCHFHIVQVVLNPVESSVQEDRHKNEGAFLTPLVQQLIHCLLHAAAVGHCTCRGTSMGYVGSSLQRFAKFTIPL